MATQHHVRPCDALAGAPPQYAVLVTGLLRTMENVWPSLLESVVRPNQADVFLQVYSDREPRTATRARGMQEDEENRRRADRMSMGASTGSYDVDSLVKALATYDAVKRINLEHFVPSDNVAHHSGTSVRIVSQGRQTARGAATMREYVQTCRNGVRYSFVLRTRPDIAYPIEPFPFPALHELSKKERSSGKHALFLPLNDDFSGMLDQMAAGSQHAIEQYAQWGDHAANSTSVINGPEAAMAAHINVLRQPSRGFVVKRFFYEYSLVRPRDAYVFTYLGPEMWSQYNNNAFIWRNINCAPGLEVVAVGTRCSTDPASDFRDRTAAPWGDRTRWRCEPKPKSCPTSSNIWSTSAQEKVSLLQPLRAAILQLVCGFAEPTEASRSIVRHGLPEASRCQVVGSTTPLLREILWNRCCRHLPSETHGLLFDEAMAKAAPGCRQGLSSFSPDPIIPALAKLLWTRPQTMEAPQRAAAGGGPPSLAERLFPRQAGQNHSRAHQHAAHMDRLGQWAASDVFTRAYVNWSRTIDAVYQAATIK